MASVDDFMDLDAFTKIKYPNQNCRFSDPGFSNVSNVDLTVDTPDEIEHNPWKEHVEMFIPTFVKQKKLKITTTDSVSAYSHYTNQINFVKNVYVNDKFVGTLSFYENNYIFRLIIGPNNVLNITSYSEEIIIMKVQVLLKELSTIFS